MRFYTTILVSVILLLQALQVHAQRWEKVALPAPYDRGYYLDIFFLPSNPQLGWACDQRGGYVIRTTNGGNSWQGTTIDSATKTCHLEYIQFLDANVGYCSGPCGMYKSVDGGATWSNIKPDSTAMVWGGWFRNANEGWFTGGGCGYNMFLKTVDGGTTFTKFIDTTVKRSALADPYWDATMPPNTLYAAGAGTIWKSESNGDDWSVHAYTGANAPWHEELAMFGQSIAVPSGGQKCDSVAGIIEGIRFSPDMGTTWRQYNTGEPMFGTFLHDANRGWAAGYSASVYYTSNAGNTWQLRNCGLEGANMDDIFFLDDATGWVVGEGVFRVAPPQRTQNKTTMAFPGVCPDSAKRDTVMLRNINWFASTWSAAIVGTDAAQFRVVNAPLSSMIASCTPQPVIVEYKPTSNGPHAAMLTIRFEQPETTLVVSLSGDRRATNAFPVDTVVTYTAKVGEQVDRIVLWRTNATAGFESIVSITRVSGDSNIRLVVPTQATVLPQGTVMPYTAVVWDTGWTQARFRVRLGPCQRDTFITIRIYGTSPIFNSITQAAVDVQCRTGDTLRVPISNTGNAPLLIRSIVAQNLGEQAFRPLGFTSNRFGPPWSLERGVSDTLLVEYVPQTGNDNVVMTIEHDDLTRTRGIKTPWTVALRGLAMTPNVEITPAVIDLGTMCTGALFEKQFTIKNNASATASLTLQTTSKSITGLTAGGITLLGGQQRQFRFTYRALEKGPVLDTIMVYLQPCDVAQRVIVRGNVEDLAVEITPSSVQDSADVNTLMRARFVVRVVGGDSATIYDVRVLPLPGAIQTSIPVLPRMLKRSDSMEVFVQWRSPTPATYVGRIEVEAFTTCSTTVSSSVQFKAMSSDLDVGPQRLDWSQQCSPKAQRDSVYLDVRPGRAVTLTGARIQEVGTPFRVVGAPAPRLMQPGTRTWVVVEYLPTTQGQSNATLVVETDVAGGTFTIPLQGALQSTALTATPRNIDAGTIAACDPPITRAITVRNAGQIQASVNVTMHPPVQGITIQQPALVVGANDSNSVTIRFDGSAMPLGLHQTVVRFTDVTCGSSDSVPVSIRMAADDRLVMTPNPVDIGDVEVSTVTNTTVLISNPGLADRTILSLAVMPPRPEWSVTGSVNGRVVPAGQSVPVDLSFTSGSAGRFDGTLVLTDVDRCTTSSTVALRAQARDPRIAPSYNLGLRIDDYIVTPGTRLSVPIYWDTDIHEANVDSFKVRIALNELAFAIDSVSVGSMEDALLTFSRVTDTVSITMRQLGASCGRPGVLAVLHGKTFSTLPDSTGLDFAWTIIWAREVVNVNVTNGSVIVDACGPRFLIRPAQDLAVSIQAPLPVHGSLTLGVRCTYADVITADLVSSAGEVLHTMYDVPVNAGDNTVTMPTTNIASGVYYVRVRTPFTQAATVAVPVVR